MDMTVHLYNYMKSSRNDETHAYNVLPMHIM